MPRQLYDEDSNPIEVPTDEELKANEQKAKEESVKEYEENLKKELKIEGDKKIQDHLKELEEGTNPNWKEVRQTLKRQEQVIAQLKNEGKTIDKDGNIVKADENLSKDELNKQIEDGVKRTAYKMEKEKMLTSFNGEEQKVVQSYLDRLMVGQEETILNLTKSLEDAIKLSFPDRSISSTRRAMNAGGRPPMLDVNKNLSSEQKDLGSKLGLSEEDIKKYS